jgi:hypothetical protein
MSDLPSPIGTLSEQLRMALRRLLRPLVALLIRSGVTFPVLAEMLRGLYVEVALHDLLKDSRAQTDSRVSLMTGVHRKEIRRLRDAVSADPAQAPPVVTLSSQIIARWLGAPRYQDAAGAPLPLPRAAPEGEPSFETLVATVTSDVRPRAVLDEWLSQGIVTLQPDERLRLNEAAYLPRPGQAEQLFYFARNLHDHIAAAAANVLAAGTPPFVDRSVHYDRLTADVARKIEAAARAAAQAALLEVNRVAIDLTDAETPADDARHRANFGVYIYVEDARPGQEAEPEA